MRMISTIDPQGAPSALPSRQVAHGLSASPHLQLFLNCPRVFLDCGVCRSVQTVKRLAIFITCFTLFYSLAVSAMVAYYLNEMNSMFRCANLAAADISFVCDVEYEFLEMASHEELLSFAHNLESRRTTYIGMMTFAVILLIASMSLLCGIFQKRHVVFVIWLVLVLVNLLYGGVIVVVDSVAKEAYFVGEYWTRLVAYLVFFAMELTFSSSVIKYAYVVRTATTDLEGFAVFDPRNPDNQIFVIANRLSGCHDYRVDPDPEFVYKLPTYREALVADESESPPPIDAPTHFTIPPDTPSETVVGGHHDNLTLLQISELPQDSSEPNPTVSDNQRNLSEPHGSSQESRLGLSAPIAPPAGVPTDDPPPYTEAPSSE